MKHQEYEPESEEEFIQKVLPAFTSSQLSPDFREQVLARIEAASASQRGGGRWGMPTWVELWTPALTVGALLVVAFTAWMQLPFAREYMGRAPEQNHQGTRGSVSNQEVGVTLYELIQKGRQYRNNGNDSEAMKVFQSVINHIAYPLNELAWMAYEQGEAARGLSWARLAAQLQSENANYLDTLAVILCTVGEQEEARQVMEKAAQLQPEKFKEKLTRFRQGECR